MPSNMRMVPISIDEHFNIKQYYIQTDNSRQPWGQDVTIRAGNAMTHKLQRAKLCQC
jgi:hypothetical protein